MKAWALAVAMVLLSADIAGAQQTGTLLPHVPPSVDRADKGAPRLMLRGFARCMVERQPGRVQRYLDLPIDSHDFNRATSALYDREGDECMGLGELQIPFLLLRASLFEASYQRYFRNGVKGDVATAPPVDYLAGYVGVPGGAAGQAVAMARFADCVARADPATSRALLLAAPASQTETVAFRTLTPRFNACLTKGVQLEFSKTVVRGAVAEALFRLSRAAEAAKRP